MERELSALRVALSTLSYMNCLLLSNEIWGNLSMKKAIRSVFILQLIVFSIVGTAIYFQNQYVSLFYKDVSYIDVLVSDEEAVYSDRLGFFRNYPYFTSNGFISVIKCWYQIKAVYDNE